VVVSSNLFPVLLPGLALDLGKETLHSTSVQTGISGREDRTIWTSTPRFRFRLVYNFLRTGVNVAAAASAPGAFTYGSYSELAVVQKFVADHYGTGDSFLMYDPGVVLAEDSTHDPAQKRVRFEDDGVQMVRLFSGVWTASLRLISVVE
jgi:hypothetical protein